jgi:DNA polymerase III subunit delta'
MAGAADGVASTMGGVTVDRASAPPQEPAPASPVELALPGIGAHPHARAVLEPALRGQGSASHAYLFHGPAGVGKRGIARAFAAALLSDGPQQAELARERIARGTHPDMTWVKPSGAAEMLVADIEEPVVAGATRTPFESSRRVFVIEAVDTMNDQAANRMLKTLEEPPSFVHLLLLTDRREDVLATIASRCQPVRFDPLPPQRIAETLSGVDEQRAQACARLALGDARLAARLAGEQGEALRAGAEGFVRGALAGQTGQRPWLAMLDAAKVAGAAAGEDAQRKLADDLELAPAKERKRFERESLEAQRRGERRARTQALDQMLRLAELWLRDVLCVGEAAEELVYAVDRLAELREDARERDGARLREGIELVQDTRLRLSVNVSEELALEALAYRLQALLAITDNDL